MYAWIWRHLPGNVPVKLLCSLLLLFVALWALFLHVFPWVDPLLPFNHVAPTGTTSVTP